nr:hypothetical protein Iba_chr13eCG9530 [Ipomoea batatas]
MPVVAPLAVSISVLGRSIVGAIVCSGTRIRGSGGGDCTVMQRRYPMSEQKGLRSKLPASSFRFWKHQCKNLFVITVERNGIITASRGLFGVANAPWVSILRTSLLPSIPAGSKRIEKHRRKARQTLRY